MLRLLLAGIAVAFRNWQEDSAQRIGGHLGIWLVLVLSAACGSRACCENCRSRCPTVCNTEPNRKRRHAAFEFHRTFMKDFVLPHVTIFGPIVFLAELAFAASMMVGLAVRFVGVLAIAYVLQLWLGLYGTPSEWPWTYMFLAMLMFLFVVEGAGRSLGFDAWLRRKVPAVREGKGPIGWFLHIAG